MKMKSLYEEYKKEFMASDTTYCCYCLVPQGDKYGCCKENHFVTFSDLYPDEQQYIIESELGEAFGEQA